MNNKLTFSEFVNKLKELETIADTAVNEEWTLEDFLDKISESDISLESVVTGDVAQLIAPLMLLKRKSVYEAAPKSKEAEEWIMANKRHFRKRYGDDWKQIMYATAYKLFGNK